MSRQLDNLVTDKKPIGRPLELDQQVLAVTIDYAKNYAKYGDRMPTVAGLAYRLGKNKQSLYRWYKDNRNDDFSQAMDQIMSGQERELLNNGLDGTFNPAITKLCLVNNHGYSDKDQSQEAGITVNVGRDKVQITHKNQTLTVESEE